MQKPALADEEYRNNPPSYDCFICYRHRNGFFSAMMIRDRLDQEGISCFLDLDGSKAGHFSCRILSAIENCRYFLLLLTPHSLDQCVKPEDWVRKEIEYALSLDRTIIPIRMDGFSWPEELNDQLPETFLELDLLDSVILSQEYFDASLSRLLRFLEIPSYSSNTPPRKTGNRTTDFFYSGFREISQVSGVDLAFHAGSYWSRENEKVDFLELLMENDVPVRILINGTSIEALLVHMRKKLKRYVPISDNIQEWKEFQKACNGRIQVRVASLPLLHRIYLLHRKDGTGILSVKNYRYGDASNDQANWIQFEDDMKAYHGYSDEFNYIWDLLSVPIEDYEIPAVSSGWLEEKTKTEE